MFITPGGSGFLELNSKLRMAVIVKRDGVCKEEDIVKPEELQKFEDSARALKEQAKQKLAWECDNPECTFKCITRYKYIKNTHPPQGKWIILQHNGPCFQKYYDAEMISS